MNSSLGCFQVANDLIMMIFEKIDDVYDAIMLGMTHDTLMVIGWRRIQSLLAQERPPWAGCRIICVGSSGNDLPDGVMSKEEQEKLRKLARESDPGYEDDETESFNLYEISESISRNPDLLVDVAEREPSTLSSEERRVLQEIIDEGYHCWLGWVLMNLSRKEYIESIEAAIILPWMYWADARCFGQLVLSQIRWSSCNSYAMASRGGLGRGDWAGDRFRIVTTNVFDSMTTGEQWKDVSKSKAEWLRDTLRSEGK